MQYKFVIPGRLNALNEYTKACRGSWMGGHSMKKKNQQRCINAILECLPDVKIDKMVNIHYTWVEKDKRRDKDNVSSFGRKVIQDALVETGVLVNDTWRYLGDFTDSFTVDKENPRIEVILEVIEK